MMVRLKAQTFEARQWIGNNGAEMRNWLGYAFIGIDIVDDRILIENRDGRVVARVNDWIVKNDSFYPMDPVVFRSLYDEC